MATQKSTTPATESEATEDIWENIVLTGIDEIDFDYQPQTESDCESCKL